ncbi:MAG: sterol desaturase family protein [Bacteroidia bacterium]|nr:sterol desaturase family protein [Bacteroidia bacterium]
MPKNFISNEDETVPMFENRFLEILTRIHFLIPVYIFLPVIFFCLYISVFEYHIPFLTLLGIIVSGLLVWTLTEYVLHRFVFHWMPPGKLGAKIHFIVHGVHHDYPSDSKRLVMVPTLSIPLAVLFYFLFWLLLGEALVNPFFIGFISGYLFYDMTHFAIHHFNFKSDFWLEIKNHHMRHHYMDSHNGYGVSSKIWDYVFRTTFRLK